MKKLFQKIFGSPPPAPPPPAAFSIPDEKRAFLRTCWKPVTEARPGAIGASKFCGAALIPSGEDWPHCGDCSQPLNLFVQISSTDLPTDAAHAFGEGILQFFYCTSSDCGAESWAPFGENAVARILPLSAAQGVEKTATPDHAFPELVISGWESLPDFPNHEGIGSPGTQEMPRPGDKLLGWPYWVQGEEYPSCPTCRAVMKLVLQIDSEDNVPYMFGDSGCGHLFQCPHHPEVLGFGWACC